MNKFSLNDKTFALISNTENGAVSSETLFHYKQKDEVIHAVYEGGSISLGNIIGKFISPASLDLLYHCITTNGELRAGNATAEIVSLPDRRLKLELEWHWLTGDKSSGKSTYIEIQAEQQGELFENRLEHLAAFIEINEEWVRHYFTIEEADRKLAANPEKIIHDGGYIFTLQVDGHIVGTCALFNEGNGVYELARMAVRPAYQGRGFGQRLVDTAISKLNELGAKKVHLLSNTKLEKAISLYKKNGFVTVAEGRHPVYSRCDIVMERPVI